MAKRTKTKREPHIAQDVGSLEEERERIEQRRHRSAWRRIQDALGAGRLEAIAAGVRYCHRHHQVPPHWFAAGVAHLVAATLDPPKRARGRPKAPADAALHFARWQLIELLRENGRGFDEAITEAVERLKSTPERGGDEALKRSHKRVRAWLRTGEFSRFAPFDPPD